MNKHSIHTFWQMHKLLLVAGALSTLMYLFLALNSQHYGDVKLRHLLSVCSVSGALSLLVFFHYTQQRKTIPLAWMIGFAALFRFIGLFSFPVLEDDFYRYLWDGRLAIELGTPYGYVPADFFNAANIPESFEHILGLINYPYIATIYGPTCQWIFALSYLIAPGEIWPLQLIFASADMVIILLLLKLSKHHSWVLLYAWSPLLIKEFAFTAHPDVFGAMLLVLALYAFKHGHWYFMSVLLALAAGVKVFALILVPFLIAFRWRYWLTFSITVWAIALPWGLKNAWLPEGLSSMAENWLFNAPLYSLLSPLMPIFNIKITLLSLFALFCGGYFFIFWRKQQLKHIRADYLFGLFFLCLPALNPWYLVWLLPFAVIYPSIWAWVASFSFLLAYASGINVNDTQLALYQLPTWILITEFSIILLGLCLDYWWKQKRKNGLRSL